MEKRLIINKEDQKCWPLLQKIGKDTLNLIKFFKPHGERLFAVLKDGRVISAGDNSYGRFGVGFNKEVKTFEEIKQLRGKSIKDIACGYNTVMVLTKDGQVWGWGTKNFDLDKSFYQPIRIMNTSIVDVKCGYRHILALNKDGKVLAWGNNDYGQVGIGNTHYQCKPTTIVFPKNVVINQIATGADHSIAVSNKGFAYGWGYNAYNQLVQQKGKNVLRPVRIRIGNKFIKSVACDRFTTCFLTTDGNLYQNDLISGELEPAGLETDVRIEHIACLDYCLADLGSPNSLFLAFSSDLIYCWGDIKDTNYLVGQSSDLIPTDLSLTQVISQYSRSYMYPAILYLQQEQEVEVSKLTSNVVIKKRYTQNLSKFFDSPRLSDIEFVFSDKRSIKVHRVILNAASNYLSHQFNTKWRENTIVTITSYPYSVFYPYLFFLYKQTLPTDDMETVISVAQLANDFNELELQKICVHLLSAKLNMENCGRIYEVAIDLNLKQLEAQIIEMLVDNLVQKVVQQ